MPFVSRLRSFNRQPAFAAQISQRALNRGLVWLYVGNGLFWSKATGWVRAVPSGGPRMLPGVNGLMGSFGSQAVSTASWYVGPPLTMYASGFQSFFARYNALNLGENNLGRLWQINGGTSNNGSWMSSSYHITWSRETSGQKQWGISGTLNTGVPQTSGYTLDQNAYNVPVGYLNGVATAVASIGGIDTTFAASTLTPAVGARPSDGLRYLNGGIEVLAFFQDGLSGLTAYEHAWLDKDYASFLFELPSKTLLTSGGADTTAPVLTSPTGTQTGSTTGTGGATTDEANGTFYSVASTSSTAPSAAQVKAGQMHTGSAAAASASTAVSSTGAKSVNFTGLSPSTTYYAHSMHEDASANQSNVVTSASFTTTSGGGGSTGMLSKVIQQGA